MFIKLCLLVGLVIVSSSAQDPRAIFGQGPLSIINCPNTPGPSLAQFDVNGPAGLYTMTFSYPPAGVALKDTITCIKVTDKSMNGFSGWPSITSGGVGQQSVKISIKARLITPMNYKIEIFS